MNHIYVFRGSPASGKGTITEAFLKEISGKIAFLELDKFRWGFHLVNRKVTDVTENEHQLAYDNYLAVLENYLRDGTYTIVTEGLFSRTIAGPHGCMQDILSLSYKYGYRPHQVLLSADYEILWERNLARQYSVPEAEFRLLYEYVMNEQSEKELKINVGSSSVEQTVNKLKKLLLN